MNLPSEETRADEFHRALHGGLGRLFLECRKNESDFFSHELRRSFPNAQAPLSLDHAQKPDGVLFCASQGHADSGSGVLDDVDDASFPHSASGRESRGLCGVSELCLVARGARGDDSREFSAPAVQRADRPLPEGLHDAGFGPRDLRSGGLGRDGAPFDRQVLRHDQQHLQGAASAPLAAARAHLLGDADARAGGDLFVAHHVEAGDRNRHERGRGAEFLQHPLLLGTGAPAGLGLLRSLQVRPELPRARSECAHRRALGRDRGAGRQDRL